MNPRILTQPNIPKPLHMVCPRNIMDDEWWDVERRKAYRKYNYHCHACGVLCKNNPHKQWIEAHETYKIDYLKGIAEFTGVVGLCYSCHAFIHSGRLYSLCMNGEHYREHVVEILTRGLEILSENKLMPFYGTLLIWGDLFDIPDYKLRHLMERRGVDCSTESAEWEDWRMIINGESYSPKFKTYKQWREHYG